MQQSTFQKIYEVVKQIPKGYVMTYGQVAELAGNKRWARVVGYALHVNPDPGSIPCHRVVNREGRVSDAFTFGGGNRQRELLLEEGVEFIGEYVDMKHCRWVVPILGGIEDE
ncbi:MAG: MGMT family protein [Lachnospiraceae bacterium]|nr:MGMT family protein [Lachnospiraceae bacterium]